LTDSDIGHGKSADSMITAGDPLVLYLKDKPYLYLEKPINTTTYQRVISEKKDFFLTSGLVLAMPLTIGGQCVGLIGLGPEYTENLYGRDDFDLLTALFSQAASALLAARTAEKLAQERESSVWNSLSAFVLHDIKNAATMLGLVKENASANIHKPEFQQDMLASVDDALKRMNKVQHRLTTLKDEIRLKIITLEIGRLVRDCCHKLAGKLPDLTIDVECHQNLTVQTDPDVIVQIFENLIINALEAGGPGTHVHVKVSKTDCDRKTVLLEIIDNGPGIPTDMMPNHLFGPFKTTKPNGGGIGLWQVKRLVECLGGTIDAENLSIGSAKFAVRLPITKPGLNKPTF
jgi:signal transduction histidine kinase